MSARESSGGAAALNMGDVRRHAKVVCVGERTKVGNVIFSRGAGATTCLHTCWNVCNRVCVSERACRCAATALVCLCVCARMSFVFLEQTLIVFDFSKDSSDALHSRSA